MNDKGSSVAYKERSVVNKVGLKIYKVYSTFNKFFSKIENLFLYIAGISILSILIAICYGVFAREVFNSPVLWTNDLAGYLLVYAVFFASPWILKNNGHVKVDLILGNLQGRVLKYVNLLITFGSSIVTFIFFWFSLKVTLSSYNRGVVLLDNIPWPEYLLLLPLALGSLLLTIRFLIIFTNLLLKEKVIET
ncbi:TRAP transporter small permease [Planococcus salinus]|uniref:TRAP transporter small permease n=1 Tax=Planococcus salinus TaxID=1848460 RepID=UPI0013148DF1|nr:TRAP transporter small permease [Planococcus salinus]